MHSRMAYTLGMAWTVGKGSYNREGLIHWRMLIYWRVGDILMDGLDTESTSDSRDLTLWGGSDLKCCSD